MVASLYLNDKTKSYPETWEKAYKAMNLFIDLEDKEGKAEANFLLDIIVLKKEHHILKSDSLRHMTKLKSENSSKFGTEEETDLKRSTSIDEESSYLNIAKKLFFEIGNQYGVARVSLTIALRKFDAALLNILLLEDAEKYFQSALQGFTLFKDYQRMITCNLKLGEIMLSKKKLRDAK